MKLLNIFFGFIAPLSIALMLLAYMTYNNGYYVSASNIINFIRDVVPDVSLIIGEFNSVTQAIGSVPLINFLVLPVFAPFLYVVALPFTILGTLLSNLFAVIIQPITNYMTELPYNNLPSYYFDTDYTDITINPITL